MPEKTRRLFSCGRPSKSRMPRAPQATGRALAKARSVWPADVVAVLVTEPPRGMISTSSSVASSMICSKSPA